MIKIQTECGQNVYPHGVGFFIEPDECPEEITFDLEGTFEEAAEAHGFVRIDPNPNTVTPDQRPGPDDEFTICFGVECPACKALLEWPQAWSLVVEEDENSFECGTCGERVEYADLGAVFKHEHKGLTDDPKIKGIKVTGITLKEAMERVSRMSRITLDLEGIAPRCNNCLGLAHEGPCV